ncbi:hypothetical protein [Ruminococcus sp. XPD3002]|uniref:hypothetical protein n=1 Tax=Ruminococcus sp. XPD3002 TaxID=1452269 RepID=UPI00091E9226|nr:5-methylcytosine-specific restriction enzyme A [Ruminococcus flavefaciens]
MQKWIVPCNQKYYKVEEAFSKLKRLDWKQSSPNIKIGDIVYIYVSKPVMAILFKCKVTKVNLDRIEIDDSEFVVNGENYLTYPLHMELEFIKKYNDELTMNILSLHGVKGRIQSTRKVCQELENYLSSIE